MTLIYLSAAWVAGIYLGSKIALPIGIICLGLLPLCLIPFLRRYKKHLLLAGFCLLVLFGGCLRFQSSLPVVNEQHLQFYNDKGTVEIKGKVCNEPEARNTASILQLSASEIQIDGAKRGISGKALIRVPRYQEYHYGDILKVTGKLETPPQFDDFDYKGYLARQGIYSIINYPKIEKLDTAKGFKPLGWIYSLRNRLSQSLSLALPEPQASLAQGIFLGLRGNIPYSLQEAFSRTGTAHLLAISGLHLSIIIGIFLSAAIWLFGRRYSIYIWLAFLAIWLYALVTGMRPPVVRGAVMGSMFLLAEYLGRQRSASTALALAAAVMVGIEPQVLWDASFQLSFLAMAGLILLSPYFQAWARRGVAVTIGREGTAASLCNFAADSFAVTSAAVLATWPVIAHYFDVVSFVSLPATFFALLALPGIIITSALVGGTGLLAPFLAQILGWVAWLFLSYVILVVQAFDALPFSSAKLSSIHIWQIWIYYAFLAVIMAAINYRKQLADFIFRAASKLSSPVSKASGFVISLPQKWVIFPLLIATILVWVAILNMPDDKLHVSILDVGQGDAILIQTPNRQDILIDGGPSPQAIGLELGKKLPFWDRTIDLVILTQPQADHVAGLIEVLQKYKVPQVIEPGIAYSSATYQQWLSSVEDKEIKHEIARAGQEINLGSGIKIEILHPSSPLLQNTSDDIDNNGMVLRLSWNKVSFLFTADIGREAEWYLGAQRANMKSTVLKVAHHGSRTSTSPEFLAVVNPEIAAISVGANNRFGLPHSQVVDRLAERLGSDRVYMTSTHGTIEFVTDGERLWVKYDK
ncbi:MAG: DNA internalization-related competence protein ComEC/Rec2 [Chloroflexi bacterium]|nr:DNA internalization-related competence protein ComEC/Rec2 [Chloroflexota bacterium]